MKKVWIGIALVIMLIAAIGTNPTLATSSGESGTSGESRIIVDSGKCGANLRYSLDDEGVLVIEGTGNMYNYYNYGNPLSCGPWDSGIKHVIFQNGITSISKVHFQIMISGYAAFIQNLT